MSLIAEASLSDMEEGTCRRHSHDSRAYTMYERRSKGHTEQTFLTLFTVLGETRPVLQIGSINSTKRD